MSEVLQSRVALALDAVHLPTAKANLVTHLRNVADRELTPLARVIASERARPQGDLARRGNRAAGSFQSCRRGQGNPTVTTVGQS